MRVRNIPIQSSSPGSITWYHFQFSRKRVFLFHFSIIIYTDHPLITSLLLILWPTLSPLNPSFVFSTDSLPSLGLLLPMEEFKTSTQHSGRKILITIWTQMCFISLSKREELAYIQRLECDWGSSWEILVAPLIDDACSLVLPAEIIAKIVDHLFGHVRHLALKPANLSLRSLYMYTKLIRSIFIIHVSGPSSWQRASSWQRSILSFTCSCWSLGFLMQCSLLPQRRQHD